MQLVNREDTIQNTQYTFTGLKDVYDSMCLDVSGASRIPVTKLFGRSPAGMNATGESDLKNYYDYVDSLREGTLRPILERLLPVILLSSIGYVPDDLDVQFPPLWTPTAKEVGEIAKAKGQIVIEAFQAGLLDQGAAMEELKKLSDETGMFGSISDDAIAAANGRSYQDVTSLKDPLAGIPEDPGPFEVSVADAWTFDYPGQPREENGKFSFGKMPGARKESLKKSGKSSTLKMSRREYQRVSSGILTDHPMWKPGEIKRYEYGKYQYHVEVMGPGSYNFLFRKKLK